LRKKIPKEYIDKHHQEELLKAKGLTVWKESNLPKEFFSKDAVELLCASYSSPPLRQVRSPLHTNFFA
jgi:hypothetical protein